MRRLIAIVGVLALAGCDGHARSLHLMPPGAERPGWTVTSVLIPIRGDEDVPGIVSRVARDLGFDRDPKDGSYRRRHDSGSLTMSVRRQDEGYWTVSLLDWPRFTRSPESREAERAIRAALQSARETAPASAS